MRALAAFAPGYFHDLKGPLNTIVLRLELLRAVPGGELADDKRRASVAAIEEQVRRLDRLLLAWLMQTAPPDSTPAAGDLRDLVQGLTALAAPTARKRRVELAVSVPDEPVPARAPFAALATALLDLLRHGLESLDDGGALRVDLTPRGSSARLTLRGGGFDAAATAIAARVVSAAGGTCALASEPNGTAVVLDIPLS